MLCSTFQPGALMLNSRPPSSLTHQHLMTDWKALSHLGAGMSHCAADITITIPISPCPRGPLLLAPWGREEWELAHNVNQIALLAPLGKFILVILLPGEPKLLKKGVKTINCSFIQCKTSAMKETDFLSSVQVCPRTLASQTALPISPLFFHSLICLHP